MLAGERGSPFFGINDVHVATDVSPLLRKEEVSEASSICAASVFETEKTRCVFLIGSSAVSVRETHC